MSQRYQKKKGFTLIELLVVIAIIGILSAIVLVSLGIARDRSNDAKVEGQMKSVINAAEIYNHSNGGYGTDTDCTAAGMGLDTDSGMANLMTAANWPDQTAPFCSTDSNLGSVATAYSAYHALSSGDFWCVDSTGQSKQELSSWTAPIDGGACPP